MQLILNSLLMACFIKCVLFCLAKLGIKNVFILIFSIELITLSIHPSQVFFVMLNVTLQNMWLMLCFGLPRF